jgi:hypothetical protein
MATNFAVGRRRAIQGLGLMMLAPGLSSMAQDIGAGYARNTIADDAFDRFLRMRTSPDGSPVLWVYSGVLVVKPEGEVARAVARIEGLSRSQATQQRDGRWLWDLDEAGYFCDLTSGDIAEKIFNPFTATWVRPGHYRSPQKLLLSARGIEPGMSLPEGVEFRGEITTLAQVAGTVAMTEDLYVKLPSVPEAEGRAARPERFAASLATFTTREANFNLASSQWVDCQFNYTTLNSFVGWLGMAGQAGVQDMRIVGVKIRQDAQTSIAAPLRQRIMSEHRDLLV